MEVILKDLLKKKISYHKNLMRRSKTEFTISHHKKFMNGCNNTLNNINNINSRDKFFIRYVIADRLCELEPINPEYKVLLELLFKYSERSVDIRINGKKLRDYYIIMDAEGYKEKIEELSKTIKNL